MRPLLLALTLAALLPATADAQRRYRFSRDDDRGTDLQVLARGLNVDGMGLRFWLTPQTALATRFDFDLTSVDGPDATMLTLGVGLNAERHMARSGPVHPYFTIGGRVGVASFSRDDAFRDDDRTQTFFGGEAGLGAEARLTSGLTFSGQYTLSATLADGDGDAGVPEGDPVPGFGDRVTNVSLGGVPRLALSLRF